jgi:hypothetical protein
MPALLNEARPKLSIQWGEPFGSLKPIQICLRQLKQSALSFPNPARIVQVFHDEPRLTGKYQTALHSTSPEAWVELPQSRILTRCCFTPPAFVIRLHRGFSRLGWKCSIHSYFLKARKSFPLFLAPVVARAKAQTQDFIEISRQPRD